MPAILLKFWSFILISLLCPSQTTQQQECEYVSFECDSGDCIPFLNACDGDEQCQDGSDESICQGDCDVTLTEPEGTFNSPYYPRNYINDITCITMIIAPTNQTIVMTILDFDIEWDGPMKGSCPSNKDTLSIYDGDDSSSPLLGEYCGTLIDRTFRSTGPYLYVIFKTDSGVRDRGFQASYNIVTPGQDTIDDKNKTQEDLPDPSSDNDIIIAASIAATVCALVLVVCCVSLTYFTFRNQSTNNSEIQSDYDDEQSVVSNEYDVDFSSNMNAAYVDDEENTISYNNHTNNIICASDGTTTLRSDTDETEDPYQTTIIATGIMKPSDDVTLAHNTSDVALEENTPVEHSGLSTVVVTHHDPTHQQSNGEAVDLGGSYDDIRDLRPDNQPEVQEQDANEHDEHAEGLAVSS